MCHGVMHSLIYQIQPPLATSLQGKIEEIFRQFTFPWHCYIAQTQGCTKLFITERGAYSQWKIYIINNPTTCVV